MEHFNTSRKHKMESLKKVYSVSSYGKHEFQSRHESISNMSGNPGPSGFQSSDKIQNLWAQYYSEIVVFDCSFGGRTQTCSYGGNWVCISRWVKLKTILSFPGNLGFQRKRISGRASFYNENSSIKKLSNESLMKKNRLVTLQENEFKFWDESILKEHFGSFAQWSFWTKNIRPIYILKPAVQVQIFWLRLWWKQSSLCLRKNMSMIMERNQF